MTVRSTDGGKSAGDSTRTRTLARTAASLAAAAALLGAVAHGGAAVSATTSPYALVVSTSADRSSPVALDGHTVFGKIYVYTDDTSTGVSRVRFWLDDPNRTRTPWKTEKNWPHDFNGTDTAGGAIAYDTAKLSEGQHVITAQIDLSAGGSVVTSATFDVRNSVPPPPAGPSAPDQVHLAWADEPATTLTVVWRTKAASAPSRVEYRAVGAEEWQSADGALRPSGTAGTLHETTLRGLTPSTRYEYRVNGDDTTVWSSVFETRTAPPPGPASFDAVYVADTGIAGRVDGLTTGTKQVVDEIAKLNPLLVLPGGDYAYYNTDGRFATLDDAIDAWFNQMQPVAARSPLMPTYGNHEVLLGESYSAWADRFPTPTGFDGRRNFSFDVGDVHFVSVLAVHDFNPISSSALAWIKDDIAAAQARGQRWVIPYLHVSPFADGKNHPSNVELREQLGPVFEQLGVKLVLTSHDQAYERTYPLTDIGVSDTPTSSSLTCYGPNDGVVWAKISPGGKLSNKNHSFSAFATEPPPHWTAVRNNTMHNFGRVVVSAAGSIRLETYGVKGDGTPPVVLDSFEITADGCGPALTLEPKTVALTVEAGKSTAATVALGTNDGESAAFSVVDDASWLTATPASASAPATLTLAADAAALPAGTYAATVTASAPGYEPAKARVTLTVTSSTGQAVTSFTLIDADKDVPVPAFDPIPAGAVIDRATLPTRNLNLRANTSPAIVGSVRFALNTNANYRTETGSPYALAGDVSGDYKAWNLSAGAYTVKGTPFTAANAGGTAGTPHTITFTLQ